ncbi:aldo/keto reductase [Pyxidicoccus sp. 3LFB2]
MKTCAPPPGPGACASRTPPPSSTCAPPFSPAPSPRASSPTSKLSPSSSPTRSSPPSPRSTVPPAPPVHAPPPRHVPPWPPRASSRPLGRTGLTVSPLVLSGAHLATPQPFFEAHDAGLNTFFWEPRYAALTQFLRSGRTLRDGLVIVAGSYHSGASALRRDVESALRRLRTSWLDVFLLFWVRSPERLNAEDFVALEQLRTEGKVRAFGFSTHLRDVARDALSRHPWPVVMTRHSAAHPGAETAFLPEAAAHGTGVLTFTATCYGRLLQPAPGCPTGRAAAHGRGLLPLLPLPARCQRHPHRRRAAAARLLRQPGRALPPRPWSRTPCPPCAPTVSACAPGAASSTCSSAVPRAARGTPCSPSWKKRMGHPRRATFPPYKGCGVLRRAPGAACSQPSVRDVTSRLPVTPIEGRSGTRSAWRASPTSSASAVQVAAVPGARSPSTAVGAPEWTS